MNAHVKNLVGSILATLENQDIQAPAEYASVDSAWGWECGYNKALEDLARVLKEVEVSEE